MAEELRKIAQNSMLSEKQHRAAWLVASDELTNEQIAKRIGIAPRTLDYWKSSEPFIIAVSQNIQSIRLAIMTTGIAEKTNRIKRLDGDWKRLQRVVGARSRRYIAARKKDPPITDENTLTKEEEKILSAVGISYPQDDFVTCDIVPEEAETGLVILVETPTKTGVKREWSVDTGLLGELRNIEKQAAQELGQWTEKTETRVSGVVGAVDLSKVPQDELRTMAAILQKATSIENPDA